MIFGVLNLKKYGYWWKWCYNPFSVFLSYVFTKKGYWKPRRIKFDSSIARELKWRRNDPHSWWLAWEQFKNNFKKFKIQKWWTYNSWLKNKSSAVCPSCGKNNFDID